MKTLIVIRHAHSSYDVSGNSDFTRPLSKTGEKEAVLMAKKIFAEHIIPDLLICSPTLRTIQTAAIFCESNSYHKENIQFVDKLYHADSSTIFSIISTQENVVDTLFLFGHNPGITDFINLLDINVRIDNMPTCGMFAIKINTNFWADFSTAPKQFLFFDYPNAQSIFS